MGMSSNKLQFRQQKKRNVLTKLYEMVKLPCLKWKVEAPASHQTYIVGWLMSQEIFSFLKRVNRNNPLFN